MSQQDVELPPPQAVVPAVHRQRDLAAEAEELRVGRVADPAVDVAQVAREAGAQVLVLDEVRLVRGVAWCQEKCNGGSRQENGGLKVWEEQRYRCLCLTR